MPFTKGHSVYPRKCGPINLSLSQKLIYRQLEKFLKTNIKDIQTHFEQLDGKDKLYFIESLFDYCIPKKKSTDVTSNGESVNTTPLQIVVATKDQETKINEAIKEISQ